MSDFSFGPPIGFEDDLQVTPPLLPTRPPATTGPPPGPPLGFMDVNLSSNLPLGPPVGFKDDVELTPEPEFNFAPPAGFVDDLPAEVGSKHPNPKLFRDRQRRRAKLAASEEQQSLNRFIASKSFGEDFVEGIGKTGKLFAAGLAEGSSELIQTGASLADIAIDAVSGRPMWRAAEEFIITRRAQEAGRLLNDEERAEIRKLRQEKGIGLGHLAEEALAPGLQTASDITEGTQAPALLKGLVKSLGHLSATAPAIGLSVAKFGTKAGMAFYSALPGLSEGDLKQAAIGAATGYGFGEVSQLTKIVKPKFLKALAEGAGFTTVGQGARVAQGLGLDTDSAIQDFITGIGFSTHGSLKEAKGGKLDFGGLDVGTTNVGEFQKRLGEIHAQIKKLDNSGFAGERELTPEGKPAGRKKKVVEGIAKEPIPRDQTKPGQPPESVPEPNFFDGPTERASYKKAVDFTDLKTKEMQEALFKSKNTEPTTYEQAQDRRIADFDEAVIVDHRNTAAQAANKIAELKADGVTSGIKNPLSTPEHGRRKGRSKYGEKSQKMDEALNVALEITSVENLDVKIETFKRQNRFDKVELINEALRIVNPPAEGTPEYLRKYQNLNQSYQLLSGRYSELGDRAVETKVIESKLENFSRHKWEGQERVISGKERTFKTIIDGWLDQTGTKNGRPVYRELAVKGAVQNYGEYAISMENAITKRQFFERANHIAYEGMEGQQVPLFSMNPKEVQLRTTEGITSVQHEALAKNPLIEIRETKPAKYKEVKAPRDLESPAGKQFLNQLLVGEIRSLKGKLYAVTEPAKTGYFRKLEKPWVEIDSKIVSALSTSSTGPVEVGPGRRVSANTVYAPEHIAEHMTKVFEAATRKGKSGKFGVKFDKFNNARKHTVLFTSLFHPRAIWTSWFLGTGKKPAGQRTPGMRAPVEAGLNAAAEALPATRLLVRNGLTYSLGSPEQISQFLNTGKTRFTRYLQRVRSAQEHRLFNETQSGLKVHAAQAELLEIMKKHPEISPEKAARMAARLINADFGGLNYQRLAVSRNELKWARRFFLASDWTMSNLISFTRALPVSHRLGQKKLTVRGVKQREPGRRIFTAESKAEQQLYQKFWARIVGKGLAYTAIANLVLNGFHPDEIWKGVKDDVSKGKLPLSEVNVTNIAKVLGTYRGRKVHWELMGHFKDPSKWIGAAFVDFSRPAKAKGSIMFRYLYDAMSGTDWKGAGYNDWEQMLKTGKLTSFRAKKRLGPLNLPAYTASETINSLPIFLQEALKTWTGDSTWTTAAARAIGIPVSEEFDKNARPVRPLRPSRPERPTR